MKKGQISWWISFKKRHGLFYTILMLVPVVQFLIFYIGVNINSILYAFQDFNFSTGTYEFVGVKHIVQVFNDFTEKPFLLIAVRNSFLALTTNILTLFLGTFFSYYIYKKRAMSKFFKIMLFMPAMISSISMTIMFRYFMDRAIPEILLPILGSKPLGMFSSESTSLFGVLLYSVFIGFSAQILLLLGGMEGIPESVIESARIDGASPIREFVSVVIPLIFPTIVTFLVVQVGSLFANQMNVYTFFGDGAEYSVYTIGYYLYKSTLNASSNISQYPYLAAFGVILTLISIPITFIVKFLLEKFGPSTEA